MGSIDFSYKGSNYIKNLEHFFSLPIPAIQNYRFNWQNPNQVFSYFEQEEQKWIESRSGTIIPRPEDKIILSFPDKSAWFLLPRGSCEDEANAMGHCGNAPTVKPGQRILSYRTFKNKQWYVHLTFILYENGGLGEMKGSANNKPSSKYHPYILDLLIYGYNNGLIKGVHSQRGYRPENNFMITDLNPELFVKFQKGVGSGFSGFLEDVEQRIIILNNAEKYPLIDVNLDIIKGYLSNCNLSQTELECIQDINNEKKQLLALQGRTQFIYILLNCKAHISEKVQLYTVRENGDYIKNIIRSGIAPSTKIIVTAILEKEGQYDLLNFLRQTGFMTDDVQIGVVNTEPAYIYNIIFCLQTACKKACEIAIRNGYKKYIEKELLKRYKLTDYK